MKKTVKAQTGKPYLKETIRVKNFMLAISGVNESGFRKEKDEYKKPVVELKEFGMYCNYKSIRKDEYSRLLFKR